jgi:hypothetical protein
MFPTIWVGNIGFVSTVALGQGLLAVSFLIEDVDDLDNSL